MRANIADYRINGNVQIEHFNVLLLGTPSSGKTSLRNTIGSAFSDNILKLAFAGGSQDDSSLTKKVIKLIQLMMPLTIHRNIPVVFLSSA